MTEPTELQKEREAVLDVIDAYNAAIDDNIEDVALREKIKNAAEANIYTAILQFMLEERFRGLFPSIKKENNNG